MTQGRVRTVVLIIYLGLIAIIPPSAFVLSKNFRSSSSANTGTNKYFKTVTTRPATPSASANNLLAGTESDTTTPSPTASPDVSFGPTLSFKVALEGRPAAQQATKMFLGIAEGQPRSNPTYLLSFTVDVPNSGDYRGLSLAGLTVGSTYTAYLKGKTQLATSSAFVMKPTETYLNSATAINMLTGDLNEDNIINNADLTILQSYYGYSKASPNFFPEADFNLDGVINIVDLALILRNMNRAGQSGSWISTPATGSAELQLTPGVGSAAQSSPTPAGYWMWVPK